MIRVKDGQKIRVVELVHTKDGVVPVEALTPEQKQRLDQWIVTTWVNTLYAGRAEVCYADG